MKKTISGVLIALSIVLFSGCSQSPQAADTQTLKTRDSLRTQHISQIQQALEDYNMSNEQYPDTEGCIGEGNLLGTKLNKYFSSGSAPTDPAGSRNNLPVKFTDCLEKGKYYYKYIGDISIGNYYLITVMEIPSNNNVAGDNLNAIDVKKLKRNFNSCPEDQCDFYVYIN